jgi:hypothetical protein
MLKNRVISLILFLSFFFSCLLSINNIYKYDKNIKNIDNNTYYHQMIKFDTLRFMSGGDKIKDQLKNGISLFATGDENFTKYLPSRIAAIYYYFINVDLFSDSAKKIINTGIHLPYLVIQSLFYYLSLLILYHSIKKKISYRICLIIISFLSLEPTIFQYHSTFWSESYFFSLQIILLSLIINKERSSSYILIGFITSLLALQKELAYFYIIIIIFYYMLVSKKKIKAISYILLSFLLIQITVGFNNYKRSGKFYILPATTKFDLHLIIVKNVVTKKENITEKEFFINEGVIALDFLKQNSIDYKIQNIIKNPNLWEYRDGILNEKDRVILDEFILKRSKYFFLKYPMEFIKEASIKSIHMLLLNPFHIYSDHKYESGEIYYNSEEHKKLIPFRVIYSIIIYLIIFIGLITSFAKEYFKINLYLFLSIFYFYITISWHGNTRYILPSVIYLSIFFGFGMDKILQYFKIKKKLYN